MPKIKRKKEPDFNGNIKRDEWGRPLKKNSDNTRQKLTHLDGQAKNKNKSTQNFSSKQLGKIKNMSKQTKPISIYKKIAATFIVLTLLLVSVVVYFSVVSVKIVIIPNKERTATSFVATIKDATSQEKLTGMVAEGLVRTVEVEASQEFDTTGKDVANVAIVGKVTITNTSKSAQPLMKTTRLLSPDNKIFRLKQGVSVPAGGTVENVEIYTDEPTQEMAINPTKFTIPGLNVSRQESVYAESFEKFQYQEQGDSKISATDLKQAQDRLKQELNDKLKAITESNEYKIYDNVIAKVSDEKIKFSTNAKEGDKSEKFSMSATGEAAVVAFSTEAISNLARLKVAESLPDDKQLESFDENNFEYSVDRYNLDKGIADLKVDVAAQMILREGTEIIKADRLVGLTREQLDDYLSSLREVAGYEVKFTPNWITKVPSLVDHVKIEIAK